MSTAGSHIVVLGGGVGGQVAAGELRRLLPSGHRVTIVERERRHAFAPSFLWVMTGDRRPDGVTGLLGDLVRPGVHVIHDEVQRIDRAARRVELDGGAVEYDYLVIALGADLAPEVVPGLADEAHTFYTLDGAARLRAALDSFEGSRVAVVVASLPYKCPGAPHEGAMLIADYLSQRRRRAPDVQLYTPEPQPMPVAGPALGSAVRQMLEARRIGFNPLHRLVEVRPESRAVVFDGLAPVAYDLLVAIPPHRPPKAVAGSGLVNDAGWVPVDRRTLATRDERVFALGDVTAITLPGRWKPDAALMLPKAGVFAHAQALVAARRIAALVGGREPSGAFCGDGFCMLEAGEGAAGVAFGDFFAEPAPRVQVRPIGRTWHLGKVLFERWWLAPQGLRKAALEAALRAGSRALGIPVSL
jgi:sulfide:quinone oxidoreductase